MHITRDALQDIICGDDDWVMSATKRQDRR
jgi:hypothetical protein